MKDKFLSKYWRVADVNFNRAREGLRVIEDTARFIRNDEKLVGKIRRLRRQLRRLNRPGDSDLLRFRDVESDCGREFKEDGNYKNIGELVQANFRRVEEALRVLEEYSRLLFAGKRAQFKRLRFALYQLEKFFPARVSGKK
jgi:thiamine-phosphate pyrophosphorylase